MIRLTRRRALVVMGLLIVFALVLVGQRLNATKVGGHAPAEPLRIAGNFYYVGASDVSAFLIASPQATSCSTPAIPRPRFTFAVLAEPSGN